MKIATTTEDFLFYLDSDVERIRELHKAGFRYIDLSMYNFSPDSPYMQENWREEVQKIKAVADELGMQFVQAHSQGGRPMSEDKEHVDFLIKATIRSIEICEVLGIKNTVVHGGHAVGLTKEGWFKRAKAFYEQFFPTMERCGVNVLCENGTQIGMNGMWGLYTGKDMREFVEYVNHPLFHACWDTGHANCEGSQYNDIMALGKELYAIHYNDNSGTADQHLMPYLGTMNHDEVFHALIDVGYKGYFTLEACSTLRKSSCWYEPRRAYDKDERLREPQLFMQRKIEALTYDIAEYMLKKYDLFEE